MNEQSREREIEALMRAKPRYEHDGFEFLIGPSVDDVPAFLEGYLPDAIARKGNRGVVIGVKSRASDDDDRRKIAFFAREVPKHDGWRFDLLLPEQGEERTDPAFRPTLAEVEIELERVRRLVAQGDLKVALPYAWALLESVVRSTLIENGTGTGKRYLPRTVVEKLISEGIVTDDDGAALLNIGQLRNAIVHGYTNVVVTREQIEKVINAIGEVVAEAKQSSPN
jgi:hypothetical protein